MPYLNIKFPFIVSPTGVLFDDDKITNDIVKSNLIHLLSTTKKKRLYFPDFGVDLRKFLFDPKDTRTQREIEDALREGIKQFMPSVHINSMNITKNGDRSILVEINYDVNEGILVRHDIILLEYSA